MQVTQLKRKPQSCEALLWESLQRLESWIEVNNWQGYDPFDGLSSRWSRPLTFEHPRLRQLLQQLVKRSPWNLRPLLAIQPTVSSKSMGLFSRAFLKLHKLTNNPEYLKKALFCLEWLEQNPSSGYSGYCWGNAYDYQSRVFFYKKGVPTIVGSVFIAHSFLDAYKLLGEQCYLSIACSCADFILKDLEIMQEEDGVCLGYIPGSKAKIHNANMLGAGLLARLYSITREQELLRLSSQAVQYTLKHQREDGSWFYGEAPNLHWIDNFHTGYVLEALYQYLIYTGNRSCKPALRRGLKFYIEHFIAENGAPCYYQNQLYPIDIQCAAQSIIVLALLREWEPRCLDLAKKVALWSIDHMQDPSGYFYYQKHRWLTNKTPMIHWGQANMIWALAVLLEALQSNKESL